MFHIGIKKMMSVRPSVCLSVHIKSSSATDHRCKKEQEMSSLHKIFFSPATKYFFLPPLPRKKHDILLYYESKYTYSLRRVLDPELSLSLLHTKKQRGEEGRSSGVRLASHPRGAAPLGLSYSNKEDDVRPSVCPSISKVLLRQITDAKRSKK